MGWIGASRNYDYFTNEWWCHVIWCLKMGLEMGVSMGLLFSVDLWGIPFFRQNHPLVEGHELRDMVSRKFQTQFGMDVKHFQPLFSVFSIFELIQTLWIRLNPHGDAHGYRRLKGVNWNCFTPLPAAAMQSIASFATRASSRSRPGWVWDGEHRFEDSPTNRNDICMTFHGSLSIIIYWIYWVTLHSVMNQN